MIGKIHSCETMGSVDGPGLRYVIFFQGCNMKCLYCHNRDTWDCSLGKEITEAELAKQIQSLKGFYKSGNGGVTVSGGEPLLQSNFISPLFDDVHGMGLTTAVDSSGHVVLTNSVKSVLSKTDYLLMDVKSLSEGTHKKLTGVNRNLVVPFFEYIRTIDIKVWLRYVYVPGYTDSEKNMLDLVDFINSFNNIERLDILPYHNFGKEKWENLGYKYPLSDLVLPNKKNIDAFRNYIKDKTMVIVK